MQKHLAMDVKHRYARSDARPCRLFASVCAALTMFTAASAAELVEPKQLIVDGSRSRVEVEAQILAARNYDTFWNTGEETFAMAALAPDFVDRTLPAGRARGIQGALAASKFVRAAIPDLTCEIEQMIVAGDRVVTHLHFRGHFTGRFNESHGKGEEIDFIATDIYRVVNHHIAENWHIEDNLTLLRQLHQVGK